MAGRPTFIFLKGKTKVDQVRGANKSYGHLCFPRGSHLTFSVTPSGLENAIRMHSSGLYGAFTGKGNTLSGSSFPDNKSASATLSPQLTILLGLVGAYFVLWYLS
jgi:thioredoxin 1